MTERLPLWRIHLDLLTARLLLTLAPSAAAKLGAEDHRFLAVRHAQLATRWRQVGWKARANAHDDKAAAHWRAAGADEPPPAVAVGMPRPYPYARVDARGRVVTGRWDASEPSSPDPSDHAR
jgi:hypothetical protein